jgi:DNA-binding LacI/PurR family transcriptional regulator
VGRVTLQTVADKVGVSRMTVSNAFSRPDQLSDELRKKILAAAEELGYWGPDPSGRALARGRTGAVGVMLTDDLTYAFTDQYATDLMASICSELAPTGVALTLLTAVSPSESVPARDVPLDGAMVLACSDTSESIDWLRRRKLPIVFVDQEPLPDVTSINIDETGGARAAAEHIVELGHTRIAVITTHLLEPPGPMALEALAEATRTTRMRTMGWIDALAEHGITPELINAVRPNVESGAAVSEPLLGRDHDRPTAVICFSDTLAAGVLRTARRLGIDVPTELSIVGFDDMQLAASTTPPLTTVHQDVEGKGRAAASLLKQLIAHKAAGEELEPQHVTLPTHLVVRGSTGPAPVTPAR